MATATRRRQPQATTTRVGPFHGVITTNEPFDEPPDILIDATNLYIADPTNGSGAYARPGATLQNNGAAVVTAGSTFRGQGIFSHTALNGVVTNFQVMNGRLFRVDTALTTFTDVTPTTIDAGVTTRVYGTNFADQLVITDGVNRPWLATNLSSTPITATPINFDGAAGAWSAFGPAVVYAGSMFFILNSVGGVAARTDIAWSVPADAATGYQQANYDFRWTLEQTASDPLFALAAENTQLYYWRENSIGSITGIPGPDLRGQATHDAISTNVGTLSPQSVVLFGDNVFFVDALGRPYRLQVGSRTLDPLWLTLRSIVDASSSGFPGVNKTACTASFEPTLNLYLVAPWSNSPAQTGPPVEAYAFDARTGTYFGRWVFGPGIQIDCLGTFTDANGRGVLIILGSLVAPGVASIANSGYVWSLNSIAGVGDLLVTEAGAFLTTEDSIPLTTEGAFANWKDNGVTPTISATTARIGYTVDTVITVDRATALVGSTAPCTVSMNTAAVAETVEGTPTPSTVQDGISKLVVGSRGIQGRGVAVTVRPTTATSQWSFQGCSVAYVVNRAAPDDV